MAPGSLHFSMSVRRHRQRTTGPLFVRSADMPLGSILTGLNT
jgi:hypothetical protein